MPSVLTGANLANRDLIYLGVSGDGDCASIGFGQFAHSTPARRQHGLYRREQRRVRPDQGAVFGDGGSRIEIEARRRHLRQCHRPRRHGAATRRDIVARDFSGDKDQLVPIIKAAIDHKGAAFIDVISPCIAFNNHAGSTKSFDYVREYNEAVNRLDVLIGRAPITVDIAPGAVEYVEQHDGTTLALRKLNDDYDVHDRLAAMNFLQVEAAESARW